MSPFNDETMGKCWIPKLFLAGTTALLAFTTVFYLDVQDDAETVHAVLATTGEELWRTPLDRVFKDDWGQGPRCTPVVDGQHVFVQSCRGELQCLRVTDGHRLWRRNYVEDFGAIIMGETGPAAGATRHGNTGSPLVNEAHLIVQAGGQPGAGVVCLEKATGQVVWQSQEDTAGNGAPILALLGGVRQVISFTALGLIGVDAGDGELLWRVISRSQACGATWCSPAYADGRLYVRDARALFCLQLMP